METKSSQKVAKDFITPKYYCESCDYSTSKTGNWNKHLLTKKHKNRCEKVVTFCNKKVAKSSRKVASEFICSSCGKKYNNRMSLWRHKKKCKIFHETNELKESVEKMAEYAANMAKLVAQNQSTTTNNIQNMQGSTFNNQNISINLYLNEKCKGALNLTDFVENIKVTLEDLKYSKDNGLENGVTNIIRNQLMDLKPTERPIHCSDKDKLQFYIKDNNEWKEDKSNKEMKKTISHVERKQVFQLKEWEKAHPTYLTDENLYMTWQSMIHKIMHPNIVNQDTVEKNLTDIVDINDIMD